MISKEHRPPHGGYAEVYSPRDPNELINLPCIDFVPGCYEPMLYSADLYHVLREDMIASDTDSMMRLVQGQKVEPVDAVNAFINNKLAGQGTNEDILDILPTLEAISTKRVTNFVDILLETIKSDKDYASDLYRHQTVVSPLIIDGYLRRETDEDIRLFLREMKTRRYTDQQWVEK